MRALVAISVLPYVPTCLKKFKSGTLKYTYVRWMHTCCTGGECGEYNIPAALGLGCRAHLQPICRLVACRVYMLISCVQGSGFGLCFGFRLNYPCVILSAQMEDGKDTDRCDTRPVTGGKGGLFSCASCLGPKVMRCA